jgi:hypothetical protein
MTFPVATYSLSFVRRVGAHSLDVSPADQALLAELGCPPLVRDVHLDIRVGDTTHRRRISAVWGFDGLRPGPSNFHPAGSTLTLEIDSIDGCCDGESVEICAVHVPPSPSQPLAHPPHWR